MSEIPQQIPPRASHFRNRGEHLTGLITTMAPGRVLTLVGPGGVGKSAVAMEYLSQWLEDDAFPDGIITHDFQRHPGADAALESIALAYGLTPRPPLEEQARRLLAGKRALLFLDSAENCDDLDRVLAARGARCGVLVTSEDRADALEALIEVGPLPAEDAADVLRAWAGKYAADRAAARAICDHDHVGGLPLTVRMIGRYLREAGEEAVDYLAWLREAPLEALDRVERDREGVPRIMRRSLARVSETAVRTMGVVGVLGNAPFTSSVAGAALDVPARQAGLGELVRHGLLVCDRGHYRVTHRRVHTFARERLPTPNEAVTRLGDHFRRLAEKEMRREAPEFGRLAAAWPHVRALLAAAEARAAWEEICDLVEAFRYYLDLQGLISELASILEAGLRAAEKAGRADVAAAFAERLALNYIELDQGDRAIVMLQRELETAREQGDRLAEGQALCALGIAHARLANAEEGMRFTRRALALAREVGERQLEGNCLGNLGFIYLELDQSEHHVACAIDYFKQALAISRELDDPRSIAIDLGNLGEAYLALGRLDRGIDYLEQARDIAHSVGDRKQEKMWLIDLGDAYADAEKTVAADEAYEEARRIARACDDRRDDAILAWNQGRLYESSDPARAVALMSLCVAYEEAVGDPAAATSAERVAAIRAAM